MVDRKAFKNIEISRLGLGTMRLPVKSGEKRESSPDIDYLRAQEIVDFAYQNGVNYYDTAYMYHCGKSEEFVGHALKKYPRESYYVADKLPIWMCDSHDDMEKLFSNQLKRTGLEYFDFYLLHSLDADNFKMCEEYGAYEFLLKKREEGRINNIGFSFHGTIDSLKEIIAAHEWDFAQIQMNYLDWENQNAKTQYKLLTDAGIPVIVMEPVRGGKLADLPNEAERLCKSEMPDKSNVFWAMGFVASHDNVLAILSGMNSVEQLSDNLSTLSGFTEFDKHKYSVCEKIARIINNAETIPCTGCDYCADCPKGVKISSMFAVYNKYMNSEISGEEAQKEYDAIDINASHCVNCGKCKQHCPQSIDIPKMLKSNVSDLFE